MSDSIVIIPTYNEKENIENIIRAVFGLEKVFHILVIIAGYGVGIYPSIAEGAAICAKVDKTYTPNLENKKVYDEMYPVWREVYKANLDLCDRKLTKNMWISGSSRAISPRRAFMASPRWLTRSW